MSPARRTGDRLRAQPRAVAVYIVLLDLVAMAIVAATATTVDPSTGTDTGFAVLAAVAVLDAELARRTSGAHRPVDAGPRTDLTWVWVFAGVLVLPALHLAALVALLHLTPAVRGWRHRPPTFGIVFRTGRVLLASLAARTILFALDSARPATSGPLPDLGAVVISAATFFLVAALLAAPLPEHRIGSRWPADERDRRTEHLHGLAALCLGALTAFTLTTRPALVLVLIPPLLLLHRGTAQLERAATTDEKTGLLNITGWRHRAGRELVRAGHSPTRFGVLMIDVDHFKLINDRYGHLVGDQVLAAVATGISRAVREHDSVGRFGGEEFLVLLPDAAATDALDVAEGIRAAITDLTIAVDHGDTCAVAIDTSVSIGVAIYPDEGASIEQLLHTADTALYQAKNTGRNKIVSIAGTACRVWNLDRSDIGDVEAAQGGAAQGSEVSDPAHAARHYPPYP
jgi:diguanylate cyclase (GGDEF)-like protein